MTKTQTEQTVQTVAQPKQRNYAIEFWRFFFAIAITGYHIGTIMPRALMPGVLEASNWMAGAGEILFVFTLTAGYFLVKHFKRLQANPEYSARTASGRAWEYIWGRIKALLPVLALGVILGIVSVAMFKGYSFAHAAYSTFNGLWEFLGLYSAGFGAAYSQSNGAMWFISGLLICSYFIYWMMCKCEDKFAGFWAPFLFIFLGGWWAWNSTRASQMAWSTFGTQQGTNPSVIGNPVTDAVIGFNNGLLFVLVGMCGGIILYYALEKLKNLKYNMFTKIVLTLVYLAVATILVVYTINPTLIAAPYEITNPANNAAGGMISRWTVHLLCILLVGLTLLGKDYVTKLLNNRFTAKVFNYLGGSALYIYMLHMPLVYFYGIIRSKIGTITAPLAWVDTFTVVALASTVLGCVVKFLMDKFVLKKYPSKKKAVAAEAPVAEVEAPVAEETEAPVVEVKAEPVKKAPAKKPVAKTVAKAPAKKVEAPKAPVAKKAPAKKAEPAKAPAKAAAKKPATKTTKKSK